MTFRLGNSHTPTGGGLGLWHRCGGAGRGRGMGGGAYI